MSSLVLQKDFGHKKRFVYGLKRPNRFNRRFIPTYGNDTSAFKPEQWAQESVRILWENMVYASLVHRDFSPIVANFGEKVHTRKISEMSAKRKQNDLDDLETSDATATKIEVVLNQRAYISFVIGDGERSKAFQDLFDIYLEPALGGVARLLDRVIAGQVYQFQGQRAGGLGMLTSSTGHDYLLDARQALNDVKVPLEGRNMGLGSASETQLQKTDIFKSAERRGDGGRALREALLGRVDGWNNFLSVNTPSVRNATQATATTTTAAAAAGDLIVNVTSAAALATGTYYTVVGDMTPLRVSAVNTLALTNTRPLLRAVGNGAVVQPYATGLINQASAVPAGDNYASQASGYPAGWIKPIVVDGTGVPKLGQMVAFKTAGGAIHNAEYCIVDAISATQFLLDRPLEQAVLDNDVVNYGPNGDYNFGFRRNAVALVNRPLALPLPDTGARASQAVFNNMSVKVAFTYDGLKEATRVTVSSLFGIKPLDTLQGVALYG